MLNDTLYGTASSTVGTTPVSLTAYGTTIQARTTAHLVYLAIDFANMGSGDEYQINKYEAAGSAQRTTVLGNVVGAQTGLWEMGPIAVGEGWDFGVLKVTGTDRALSWRVFSALDAVSVSGATVGTATNVGTVAALAAGAVNAAAIATGAIDADAIATDAVTEIQSGLATAAALATVDGIVDDILLDTAAIDARLPPDPADASDIATSHASLASDIATVQADTDNIQTRLPTSLVSGRIDASVGAMAANVITAAATASDFGAEIADAVWDEVMSGHLTAGTAGWLLQVAEAVASKDRVRYDTFVYDGNGGMTSCRLRVFATTAAASSSTSGGSGEGEIWTVTITQSLNGTYTTSPTTLRGVGA